MIDPRVDPAAAIEEVEFLGRHMDSASLRVAINALLLVSLGRSFAQARRQHTGMSPRQQSRMVEDFLFNVAGSFRDAITADTLHHDRTVLPLVSAGVCPADRGGHARHIAAASPSPGVSLSPGRRAPLPHPGADL